MADVVLPATMFLEHDDVYQGGGHQYIMLGPKLLEAPGECRSNHDVICGLAKRVGAEHPGFAMSPREIIDWTLQKSGWGTLAELEEKKWIDCQPEFDKAHYIDGFGYPDKKFRFKPDWPNMPAPRSNGIRIEREPTEANLHWLILGAASLHLSALGHDSPPWPTALRRAARACATISEVAIDACAFQRPLAVQHRQSRRVLRQKTLRTAASVAAEQATGPPITLTACHASLVTGDKPPC